MPNVAAKTFSKIIEYLKYHQANPSTSTLGEEKVEEGDQKRTDDIIPWDMEFCKVSQEELFSLMIVYIKIQNLIFEN